MSEWISVDERLPENSDQGVHDAFPVLALRNEPYGSVSQWNIKVVTWMNNRFQGFPSGATQITHWMPLPQPPETNQ